MSRNPPRWASGKKPAPIRQADALEYGVRLHASFRLLAALAREVAKEFLPRGVPGVDQYLEGMAEGILRYHPDLPRA